MKKILKTTAATLVCPTHGTLCVPSTCLAWEDEIIKKFAEYEPGTTNITVQQNDNYSTGYGWCRLLGDKE